MIGFPYRVASSTLVNNPNTLTFSLAATPYGCTNCESAISQITVRINSAPIYGDFDVLPVDGGFASVTNFSLSAFLCVDDDLPLSYVFLYIDSRGNSISLAEKNI